MKNFLKLALLGAVLGLAACGSTTTQITFKDKNTGQVLDTKWERKDASHAFAPSTAALFDYNPKTRQVDTEGYVAGATPVEQVMPAAAAGITADGLVRAAKAERPDNVTINNSANAEASAANFTAIWQEWSIEQRFDFDNCRPVDGWRKKGCGI